MKKLLGIVVLGLLSFNINNVIAAERIVSFSCGTTDGSSEGITLSIDLDKSSMEFGLPKYKITSISDDVIIALSPSKDDGKNFKKNTNISPQHWKTYAHSLHKTTIYLEFKMQKLLGNLVLGLLILK